MNISNTQIQEPCVLTLYDIFKMKTFKTINALVLSGLEYLNMDENSMCSRSVCMRRGAFLVFSFEEKK